jgi:multidrug resistance efflux pump
MTDGESFSITYEARRQARSGDVAPKVGKWRRRLIWSGSIVGAIVVGVVAYMVIWSLTHVTTIRAQVCAEVVDLATDVDVHMVELLVKPGEQVEKGAILARLDDAELRAAVQAAEASLAVQESLCAQAKSDLTLTKGTVEAGIVLAHAQAEIAEARLAKAQADLGEHTARVPEQISRAQALCAESKARFERIKKGARKEEVAAAKVRVKTAQARADLAELECKQIEGLVKQGAESSHTLEIRKTEFTIQRNTTREAQLALEKLQAGSDEQDIRAAEKAYAACMSDLALARLGDKRGLALKAEVAICKAQLKEARGALMQAKARHAQITHASESVKEAKANMRKAAADVTARRAALKDMTIRSPVAGTIIRTFQRPGELCRKGVPTILMTDDKAGWWIEGVVHESDAASLKLGQTASVETVIGSWDYIEAEVQDVALVTSSLSSPEPKPAGGATGWTPGELVWLKLKPLDAKGRLLPGMSARCVIRVGW